MIHYDCLMYIPFQFIYLYVQSPVKFIEWEGITSLRNSHAKHSGGQEFLQGRNGKSEKAHSEGN